MTTPVDTHTHDDVLDLAHDHAELAEHTHGEDGPLVAMTPQPVPQSIQAELLTMNDGTDRVVVTYFSLNGSWTVFFDRDGALAQAKLLIELACRPPAPVAADPVVISDEGNVLPIA